MTKTVARPWSYNQNFTVISGCSGGGKSTLIDLLSDKGYPIHPEPGRLIVKSETQKQSDGLPWVNLKKFLSLALELNIKNFKKSDPNQLTFFDRCIIDTIVDFTRDADSVQAAQQYRYSQKVFLVPPWKEIYIQDSERQHSFDSALEEYDRLLVNYKKLGYETVIIPKSDPKSRVKFVLNHLNYRKEV